MKEQLVEEIGKNQRLVIVRQIKKAGELCVKDLATRLGMSYMGVKQHCIDLHRKGYLDTERNRKAVGRPELLYRVTPKANELFSIESSDFSLSLLQSARSLFGPTAPGKLLFLFFQQKIAHYRQKLSDLQDPEDRVIALAKLRDKEGHMVEIHQLNERSWSITERHNPISAIFDAWPESQQMERGMFEKVLECYVSRECRKTTDTYECILCVIR